MPLPSPELCEKPPPLPSAGTGGLAVGAAAAGDAGPGDSAGTTMARPSRMRSARPGRTPLSRYLFNLRSAPRGERAKRPKLRPPDAALAQPVPVPEPEPSAEAPGTRRPMGDGAPGPAVKLPPTEPPGDGGPIASRLSAAAARS
eukprot:CAMPEP_0206059906 /NCGR_PEP_ID=MMETSP1466-20131121/50081_1 /ASSEMBLY_ACC=CAM_ASM_001126 /TAXON_ID=44452 /ORGANISM="Pavlova gyrans, Strain CCMP608" /LENGTH=143 /DNA_ID=CAMNT_0053435233 /DNA_START=185 /DNA_END=613 /DNA_ORIENTATION=+